MRAFIDSILGVYTPTTITVDGVVVPLSGLAGVDWSYIICGLVFIVVIFCTLKLLGSMISK